MPIVKYYKVTTGVENEIVKSVNHHRFNNGEIVNVEENVIRVEADEALIVEWLAMQNCDPVEYPNYEIDNYVKLRVAEYPPLSDFVDAHVKNDTVALQAYIDKCLAVKAKYPK